MTGEILLRKVDVYNGSGGDTVVIGHVVVQLDIPVVFNELGSVLTNHRQKNLHTVQQSSHLAKTLNFTETSSTIGK